MIKAIFTDLDNTLVANQYLYDEAKASLYGYLRHFGVLPAEARPAFDVYDQELFKTLGYSRERMPAAFEATLRHFVPEADAEMVAIVREFAEEIFNTVARVKPGTPDAIAALMSKYPVYIVTAGDKGVQETRISHLPFQDKLAGAFIVDYKNKKTFEDLAANLGLKPEEIIMIGDSLKSDVIAPVQAGMQAVWIEDHNSAFEAATDFPKKNAYKFSSFPAAVRHILKNGTAAPVVKDSTTNSPSFIKFK